MDLEIIVKSLNSSAPEREEDSILNAFKSSIRETSSKCVSSCTNLPFPVTIDNLKESIFDSHHLQFCDKTNFGGHFNDKGEFNEDDLIHNLQMNCTEISARVMLHARNPHLASQHDNKSEFGFFSKYLYKAVTHAEEHRARDHLMEKEYGNHISELLDSIENIQDHLILDVKNNLPFCSVPLAPLFCDALQLSVEKVQKLDNMFHRCQAHIKPKSGMFKRDLSIKELNSLRRNLHKTRNRVLKHAFKRGRSYKFKPIKQMKEAFNLPDDVEKDLENFICDLRTELGDDEKTRKVLTDIYVQLGFKIQEDELVEHLSNSFRQLLISLFSSDKIIGGHVGGAVSDLHNDDNDMQMMGEGQESMLHNITEKMSAEDKRLIEKVGLEIMMFDRESFGDRSFHYQPADDSLERLTGVQTDDEMELHRQIQLLNEAPPPTTTGQQPQQRHHRRHQHQSDDNEEMDEEEEDILQYQQQVMQLNMPSEYFDVGDLDMNSLEVLEELDLNHSDDEAETESTKGKVNKSTTEQAGTKALKRPRASSPLSSAASSAASSTSTSGSSIGGGRSKKLIRETSDYFTQKLDSLVLESVKNLRKELVNQCKLLPPVRGSRKLRLPPLPKPPLPSTTTTTNSSSTGNKQILTIQERKNVSRKVDGITANFVEHVISVMSTLVYHFESHQSIQEDFHVDPKREQLRVDSQKIRLGKIGEFSKFFHHKHHQLFPQIEENNKLNGDDVCEIIHSSNNHEEIQENQHEISQQSLTTVETSFDTPNKQQHSSSRDSLASPSSTSASRIIELARLNTSNKSDDQLSTPGFTSPNGGSGVIQISSSPRASPSVSCSSTSDSIWKNRRVFLFKSSKEETLERNVETFLHNSGASFFIPMNVVVGSQPGHLLLHGSWNQQILDCIDEQNENTPTQQQQQQQQQLNLLKLKNSSLIHFWSYDSLADVQNDQCRSLFPHGFTCLVLDLSALVQANANDLKELLEFMLNQKSDGRIWHLKVLENIVDKWKEFKELTDPDQQQLLGDVMTVLDPFLTPAFKEVVQIGEFYSNFTLPDLKTTTDVVEIVQDFMSTEFTLPSLQFMLHLQQQLQFQYRHFCLLTDGIFSDDVLQLYARHGIQVMSLSSLLETKLKRAAIRMFPEAIGQI